mgnify:CR=1 FL=1
MNWNSVRRTILGVAITVAAVAVAPPALAIGTGGTCYQGGLTAGCVYTVEYNDGTSSLQTADGSGRIKRPCDKIITREQLSVNQGGCTMATPIWGAVT